MARLPGLRPIAEDRPDAVSGGPRQRVQVQGARGLVALQPQAAPTNVYVAPVVPAQDDSAAQLASALSSLQPELGNMLVQDARLNYEDQKEQQEAQAYLDASRMSPEERAAALAEGKLPGFDNKLYTAAFAFQTGTALAGQALADLTQRYATDYDRTAQDFDSFWSSGLSPYLDQLGDNASAVRAFTQTLDQARRGFVQDDAQRRADMQLQAVGDATVGAWVAQNDANRTAGLSAQARYQLFRETYQGNKDLLKLSYSQQDALAWTFLQQAADQGDAEFVELMLNDPRGTVGPLSGKADYAAKAPRLLAHAKDRAAELDLAQNYPLLAELGGKAAAGDLTDAYLRDLEAKHPGLLSPAQKAQYLAANEAARQRELARVQEEQRVKAATTQDQVVERGLVTEALALADEGQLWRLTDTYSYTSAVNGKTVALSPDKIREQVVAAYFQRSREQAKAMGETPHQTLAREATWLAQNQVTNAQWSDLLSNAYLAADPVALANGNVPANLTSALTLYTALHAINPALLDRHVKDPNALSFYEAYRVGTQVVRLEPDAALAMALRATQPLDAAGAAAFQPRADQLRDAVSRLSQGGMPITGWGSSSGENEAMAWQGVQELAVFYMRAGLGEEQAIKQATDTFLLNNTLINGWWVPTNDQWLPPTYAEDVEAYLDRWAAGRQKDTPGFEYDASDLTAVPWGNSPGSWLIVAKGSGLPVVAVGPSSFTPAQIADEKVAHETEERQKRVDFLRGLGVDPEKLSGYQSAETKKRLVIEENQAQQNGYRREIKAGEWAKARSDYYKGKTFVLDATPHWDDPDYPGATLEEFIRWQQKKAQEELVKARGTVFEGNPER